MKPKPIFIKIRSLSGFPAEDRIPDTLGTWKSSERTIYLRRGKWTPKVLEHELGHALLDHDDGIPPTPKAFIKQELDAEFFGYLPPRVKAFLRGLILCLTEDYEQTPLEGWRLVYEALRQRKNTPKHWFVQMRALKEEARGAERR